MKNKKAFFTAKWIAYTAMMCALVVATGFITPVPIPPFGNLYWCDGMIFLAAYLLDPLAAFIAGGLGTFLYDLIHGAAATMVPSLIIHGLQAVSVSLLVHYVFPKKFEALWAAIASLVGACFVIGGYFVLRYFITGLDIITCGYKAVANVIQEAVGITVAMLICYATTFKRRLKKSNLLPDFKCEVLNKAPSEVSYQTGGGKSD